MTIRISRLPIHVASVALCLFAGMVSAAQTTATKEYQESTLDQNKKSSVGAVGVMQLMPATGETLKVGDIHTTEANIHAGTKYLD